MDPLKAFKSSNQAFSNTKQLILNSVKDKLTHIFFLIVHVQSTWILMVME